MQQFLRQVAVLGAAGKMGRGIAYLLLQEMAREEAEQTGRVGAGDYRLVLIDPCEQGLDTLWDYFKPQLIKYAGQNINALRRFFVKRNDLVENGEMINEFVDGALLLVRRSANLDAAKGVQWVFEAIAEDFERKRQTFQTLRKLLHPSARIFTNTSSIPISYLDQQAQLEHRIIGFHFYNPPPLQKLVELIPCRDSAKETVEAALELGRRLGKTLVIAHDIAGFIGNGHFMREVIYAFHRVQQLASQSSLVESLYLLNRVSQKFLLRPMGIFQLIDYVGLDVCQKILIVMKCHISGESFACPLLDELLGKGVLGGQQPDGSQKDGILHYENGQPTAIYSIKTGSYELLASAPWVEHCDKEVAPLPAGTESWGRLHKDPHREDKLKGYFAELKQSQSRGAAEARAYLQASKEIAEKLVADGVASTPADVNTVLQLGFSHLYGPINRYF